MEVILSHKYCKGLVTTIKSGWGKGEGGLTTERRVQFLDRIITRALMSFTPQFN